MTTTHPALATEINDQPAIYCGTYHKYNSGSIFGKWIDLTQISSKDELYELCAEIHKDEEDPEFMFQDWQSIPDKYISESGINDEYFEYKEALDELSSDEREALTDWLADGNDLDLDEFRDAYNGQWDNESAFAENLIDDCYNLEQMMGNLSYYFDYEKFARDLFISDYWMSDNGHVFRR